MSIVVITSSSNRQDQTLSPSIALSLASLPFASILKPEMPMTHLFIPFTHTRASSCSHCIYRIHCVGYLPTRLLHTLFHISYHCYIIPRHRLLMFSWHLQVRWLLFSMLSLQSRTMYITYIPARYLEHLYILHPPSQQLYPYVTYLLLFFCIPTVRTSQILFYCL